MTRESEYVAHRALRASLKESRVRASRAYVSKAATYSRYAIDTRYNIIWSQAPTIVGHVSLADGFDGDDVGRGVVLEGKMEATLRAAL